MPEATRKPSFSAPVEPAFSVDPADLHDAVVTATRKALPNPTRDRNLVDTVALATKLALQKVVPAQKPAASKTAVGVAPTTAAAPRTSAPPQSSNTATKLQSQLQKLRFSYFRELTELRDRLRDEKLVDAVNSSKNGSHDVPVFFDPTAFLDDVPDEVKDHLEDVVLEKTKLLLLKHSREDTLRIKKQDQQIAELLAENSQLKEQIEEQKARVHNETVKLKMNVDEYKEREIQYKKRLASLEQSYKKSYEELEQQHKDQLDGFAKEILLIKQQQENTTSTTSATSDVREKKPSKSSDTSLGQVLEDFSENSEEQSSSSFTNISPAARTTPSSEVVQPHPSAFNIQFSAKEREQHLVDSQLAKENELLKQEESELSKELEQLRSEKERLRTKLATLEMIQVNKKESGSFGNKDKIKPKNLFEQQLQATPELVLQEMQKEQTGDIFDEDADAARRSRSSIGCTKSKNSTSPSKTSGGEQPAASTSSAVLNIDLDKIKLPEKSYKEFLGRRYNPNAPIPPSGVSSASIAGSPPSSSHGSTRFPSPSSVSSSKSSSPPGPPGGTSSGSGSKKATAKVVAPKEPSTAKTKGVESKMVISRHSLLRRKTAPVGAALAPLAG
ncbi:unnamed protein product [Amoebophrya sp. A120]|nr:unnamed protein product [Amoebophrya sp. A120]|eukprot:GSA120T00022285001.1